MNVLSLAAVIVLGVSGQKGHRVLLREAYAVGDSAEVRNEVRIQLHIETKGAKTENVQAIHREIYRMEITAVDSKGVVRGFRRNYLRHRTDLSNGQVEISSLEGKTVEATVVGRDIRVQSQPGKLDPGGITEIRNQLTMARMSLVPNRSVAAGEEWTVDPHLTARILPGADLVSINARLLEVVKNGMARMALRVKAAGKLSMSPVRVTVEAAGTASHAIGSSKPLSIYVEGPIKAAGTVDVNGRATAVQVTGSLRGLSRYRWIKRMDR